MYKQRVPVENDDTYMMSTTRGTNYDFESVEEQGRDGSSKTVDALSTKKKLKIALLSVSLWNKLFLIACVIAVSLDPLFFYIPIINEDEKCLGIDKELRTIALILRSLSDIIFIVHIVYQICEATMAAYKVHIKGKSELELDWSYSKISMGEIIPFAKLVAGKLAWRSTLTDILAVLPIPQFLVVFGFFKMRGRGYLERKKILNVFLLGQYLPRIYRIYLSSKELRQTTGIWVKALFNFFLYILASHVIGAFWYFFSIQRETSCWHHACIKNSTNVEGCMSTFYCDGHNTTARNVTFFNQFCHINVEDNATALFDFGIFLNSLKNGNTGHIHFATKLSYSFWWGLRNLSNFGTSLETSTYVWESCFAVFICVIGLLLFLYLIGNVQTFMSMEAQRWEVIRNKMLLKEKDIERWMDRNELPDDMKKEIKKNITQKLEENKDSDLENLFNILPWYTKKYLKRVLCMDILKKVPKLERMDEKVLKMICDYLKPEMYAEGAMVFHMGEPLDSMLFITEGTILTYKTTGTDNHAHENAKLGPPASPSIGTLEKGYFYGEQLLHWASQKNVNLTEVPSSADNVKCHTKVEGFVLMAKDLRTVVSKCEYWWKLSISTPRVGGTRTTPNARNVQQKPGVDPQY
ncbi:cyclic nucleotide-gated ion channel 1 [Rosa chinensis]|nr:cyclic nucleotide-gated ion channel 1 [Rosa chinensis]